MSKFKPVQKSIVSEQQEEALRNLDWGFPYRRDYNCASFNPEIVVMTEAEVPETWEEYRLGDGCSEEQITGETDTLKEAKTVFPSAGKFLFKVASMDDVVQANG